MTETAIATTQQLFWKVYHVEQRIVVWSGAPNIDWSDVRHAIYQPVCTNFVESKYQSQSLWSYSLEEI
jgi:hypothetical protein